MSFNHKVWHITEQPSLTSIIEKRHLMLFGHLARTDESGEMENSFSSSSEWLAGRFHTSWLATMKNDLSYHNLSMEDATELALDRPLWRLLAAVVQAEQWWWRWWRSKILHHSNAHKLCMYHIRHLKSINWWLLILLWHLRTYKSTTLIRWYHINQPITQIEHA